LYLSGFFIGLIFLLLVFGKKLFSWSYLPNDRVLAEIKIKPLKFSTQSLDFLKEKKYDQTYITDTVLVKGKINFEESNAQAIPCPDYTLYYNTLKVEFTKCKDSVIINHIGQ
jgi:hypothetical protein